MNVTQIAALVAIIVVVCQAVKMAGLRSAYIPLLAIVLGLVGSIYFGGVDFLSVGSGVLVGLATTLGFREVKDSITQ